MSGTRKLALALVSALVVALMALSLAGCTGGKPKGEAFIGTWDIVSMESPETEDLSSMITILRQSGAKLNLVFHEDGQLEINIASTMDDQSMKGTWEATSDTVATVEVDGATEEAVIEDGKLTMVHGDAKMVCEKASEEASGGDEGSSSGSEGASASSDSEGAGGSSGSEGADAGGDGAASDAAADGQTTPEGADAGSDGAEAAQAESGGSSNLAE